MDNHERVRSVFAENRPDVVFLPHGNDTNLDHQRASKMARAIIAETGRPVLLLLNRDPKTVGMRYDALTPFDDEEALWKSALLRLHKSQHQRNLNTRGHGFDERILAFNRKTSAELGLEAKYAEVFEMEMSSAAR